MDDKHSMKDPRDERIEELERLLAEALALIALLRTENARLREENALLREEIARLKRNSSNSSKPPSSDIVKHPRKSTDRRKKRKQGAQKGHTRHLRPALTPDQIDEHCDLTLDCCPNCGGKLKELGEAPKTSQQIELLEKPFKATEYLTHRYWCEHCKSYHEATLPEEKKSLFGPKLQTMIAWMKGRGHLSYTTLKAFMKFAFQVNVSTGYLVKIVQKFSESFKMPYEEIQRAIVAESHIHCDETGCKENGKKRWIWTLRSKACSLFHVTPSRGSEVLERLLGRDYAGLVSSDFYGAYRKFAKESSCRLQFCWAHLIREVRYIGDKKDHKTSQYGKRIERKIKEMFKVVHERDKISPQKWKRRMNIQKEKLLKSMRWGVPDDKDAQKLLRRVLEWETEYFRFIHEPIPPTNNIAEQTIRNVVIDRRITQGTRSTWGNQWLERFWSILTTCEQQGRNLFDFMLQTLTHYISNTPAPSIFKP